VARKPRGLPAPAQMNYYRPNPLQTAGLRGHGGSEGPGPRACGPQDGPRYREALRRLGTWHEDTASSSSIRSSVPFWSSVGTRSCLTRTLPRSTEVQAKHLNEQVRRNLPRFPSDFTFQLSDEAYSHLKSQFATSRSWGGRRTPPCALSKQGVAIRATGGKVARAFRAIHPEWPACRTLPTSSFSSRNSA
jgi:hypothetical protein